MSQVFIVNKANHQTLHAADRKKYALFFIGIEEGLESTRNIIFGSATSPFQSLLGPFQAHFTFWQYAQIETGSSMVKLYPPNPSGMKGCEGFRTGLHLEEALQPPLVREKQ